MVRQMLTSRSAPQPDTKKTPMGGKRMVMRTMRMAGAASDIMPLVCGEDGRLVIEREETRFLIEQT